MHRAPNLWHWVIAGLVVSLAGVGYDVARAMPQRTLPGAMRHVTHAATPAVQAAVLLQLDDCSGNLRMLHVLHRGSTSRHIQLAVIWYVGPVSDSTNIRTALPSWTAAIPLRAAPPAVVRQFASLGHTTTPALLVLDQEGRVRFTTQSPRSSREVAGLRRIIEGLTWIEEL
ncbi:hypothetical protein [Gemmatimonas sp.]|jgi:hypothetical protein|uniref:hypothetical protein n=1 Tax=Gemmatimonas sp. TaxID=1962908 RepID=UPI0037C065BA